MVETAPPRFLIRPAADAVDMSHAESAIALAAGYGHVLDGWQADALRAWMACAPGGPASVSAWLASTWGLTVARQNGKNGTLEAFELYAMAVLGLRIAHTAQKLKTAQAHLKRMQKFFGTEVDDPRAKYPELNALVKEMRKTNGEQVILLTNGGALEIAARSSNSIRGESYDVLVVDEAQEYEVQHQEAAEPAISASPSGRPVTIYLGTPPKEVGERGEPFVKVRDAAVTGATKKTTWVEWSASGDPDKMTTDELEAFVRDRHNLLASNPAYPHRFTQEAFDGEMERWSPRTICRERFNMFPAPKLKDERAVSKRAWEAREIDGDTSELKLAAVGLDMNPERTKVTITMAYWAAYGLHIEVAADSPYAEAGSEHLAEWVRRRARRRIPVVMDAFSPARSLEAHFRQRKMLVRVLDSAEWGQACMGFVDAIRDEEMSHFGQAQLTLSALGAVKEPMGKGGAWKFSRRSLDVDLSPVNSAVCAHFGAIKFGRRPRAAEATTEDARHGFF
ncbi:hypothetical protein [Micrococcus sp.]|uniref:hypothetical protein n=1 Tax=Micrococcus sp. TaxID=1271 RepID=UPI0026DB21FB|nr:hypothetical protein [Micrococcus sp.]MDO4240880.1 hypothetical protein [Micrococcus sp.]